MPIAELPSSPLAPGVSPVRIHYRDVGAGLPLVILHGGWGYDVYPFDRQIEALATDYRIVIPDRTGYGRSGRLTAQAIDFHQRAADETFALIDALRLDRPTLWGHSDGAVIALLMALARPDCLRALIVEATHLYRHKPASRAFFNTMMANPEGLAERVRGVLAREHGDRWRDVIRMNGIAWRRLDDERSKPEDDLYGRRLSELRVPTLVIHGARDPRTEPGELDALRAELDRRPEAARRTAHVAVIAEGRHSPHSERLTADEVTREAQRFMSAVTQRSDDLPQRPGRARS